MPQNKKKKPSLDAMAKAQGFPSYAAMQAWNEKYRKPITNQKKAAAPRNFLQKITDVIPIQFASRRAVAAMKGATEKKQ